MKPLGGIAVALLLAIGCGSKPEKKPIMTTEEFEQFEPTEEERTDSRCNRDDGEPFECADASECCDGYECAKDPARSHRTMYCLQI